MAGLNDLKEALTTALAETDVSVSDHIPERLAPPHIIVTEADPYVTREPENRFQEYKAHFTLLLLVKTGTNAVMTAALNDLITTTLAALEKTEFNIEQVLRPGIEEINGSRFLGTVIYTNNIFKTAA